MRCGNAGGLTKDGAPCAAYRNLSESTGLCMWHDPDRQPERDANQRAAVAGRETKEAKRPKALPDFAPDSLDHLSEWHQWAVKAVACAEIATRTGDTICRHLQQLRPTLLSLDMERRVRELEAELRKAKKQLKARRDA